MINEKEREGYLKTISETVSPKERKTAYRALENRLLLEQLNELTEAKKG